MLRNSLLLCRSDGKEQQREPTYHREAKMTEKYGHGEYRHDEPQAHSESNGNARPGGYDEDDVFGHEENHDVSSSSNYLDLRKRC